MIFKFRTVTTPSHVTAVVFGGPDGDHPALLGQLAFTHREWEAFRDVLTFAIEQHNHDVIVDEDE